MATTSDEDDLCAPPRQLAQAWAKWAIVGAVVIAVGLALSAERTGFFEAGGGRYQNRRRALGTGGGGIGAPGGSI